MTTKTLGFRSKCKILEPKKRLKLYDSLCSQRTAAATTGSRGDQTRSSGFPNQGSGAKRSHEVVSSQSRKLHS